MFSAWMKASSKVVLVAGLAASGCGADLRAEVDPLPDEAPPNEPPQPASPGTPNQLQTSPSEVYYDYDAPYPQHATILTKSRDEFLAVSADRDGQVMAGGTVYFHNTGDFVCPLSGPHVGGSYTARNDTSYKEGLLAAYDGNGNLRWVEHTHYSTRLQRACPHHWLSDNSQHNPPSNPNQWCFYTNAPDDAVQEVMAGQGLVISVIGAAAGVLSPGPGDPVASYFPIIEVRRAGDGAFLSAWSGEGNAAFSTPAATRYRVAIEWFPGPLAHGVVYLAAQIGGNVRVKRFALGNGAIAPDNTVPDHMRSGAGLVAVSFVRDASASRLAVGIGGGVAVLDSATLTQVAVFGAGAGISVVTQLGAGPDNSGWLYAATVGVASAGTNYTLLQRYNLAGSLLGGRTLSSCGSCSPPQVRGLSIDGDGRVWIAYGTYIHEYAADFTNTTGLLAALNWTLPAGHVPGILQGLAMSSQGYLVQPGRASAYSTATHPDNGDGFVAYRRFFESIDLAADEASLEVIMTAQLDVEAVPLATLVRSDIVQYTDGQGRDEVARNDVTSDTTIAPASGSISGVKALAALDLDPAARTLRWLVRVRDNTGVEQTALSRAVALPPPGECEVEACGGHLDQPNYLCPDCKTWAGPTDRCLRSADYRTCAWEIIVCPEGPVQECAGEAW